MFIVTDLVSLRIEINRDDKNISYINVCEAKRTSQKYWNSSWFSSTSASLKYEFQSNLLKAA